MAVISISIFQHLVKNGNYDFSCLKDEHTYIAVCGVNGYNKGDELAQIKENTNVLFVGPKAVNVFHGGTQLRQTLIVFEKKCQEQSALNPAQPA